MEEADYGRALAVAHRFLGRWGDRATILLREDLAQEAVIESWRRVATLRDPARFDALVRTIARRRRYRALTRLHRDAAAGVEPCNAVAESLVADCPDDAETALRIEGEWVDVDWLRAQLVKAMARLEPLNQRLLREFYEGATLAQLAVRHGMKTGRIKARLHRSRQRLQRFLVARVRRARWQECEPTAVRSELG